MISPSHAKLGSEWAGDPEAFDFLRDRATNDEDSAIRRVAVCEVGSGWADDPEALDLLRDRATNDEDDEVRQIADAMIAYLARRLS